MLSAHHDVPARNLVFLIDVSGSIQSPDKLPLLISSIYMLVDRLRTEDRVAIVVYAGASGMVLPPTRGDRHGEIRAALAHLHAGGSTNGGEGIVQAYATARRSFVRVGVNRVILATDGDFNVGVTSDGELTRLIEHERRSGVFLTVLLFGMGNLDDRALETLADHGNGNYAYIDSAAEAHRTLVREAGATLVTVAKDVKLQLEINPARVAGYRLIGYDNRRLRDEEFNDDTRDAGDIGAGHTVTALYEIVPTGLPTEGEGGANTTGSATDELATVRVRYKLPDGERSVLMRHVVRDTTRTVRAASPTFRFSAAVAAFGMLLRDSRYRGGTSLAMADTLARGALGADPHGDRAGLLRMMDSAALAGLRRRDRGGRLAAATAASAARCWSVSAQ